LRPRAGLCSPNSAPAPSSVSGWRGDQLHPYILMPTAAKSGGIDRGLGLELGMTPDQTVRLPASFRVKAPIAAQRRKLKDHANATRRTSSGVAVHRQMAEPSRRSRRPPLPLTLKGTTCSYGCQHPGGCLHRTQLLDLVLFDYGAGHTVNSHQPQARGMTP